MPAAISPTSLRERLALVKLPRLSSDSELAAVTHDHVPPRTLLSFVEAEPVLAVEVLQRANARLRDSDEPRGTQQALNLLGLSQVQTLLRAQRGRPRLTPGVPGHALCLRAMASSRLAWLYLSPWLRSRLTSDEDQRLSMLLLLGVARWKLPLAQPEIAADIERRVEAGERRTRVERSLLGTTLDELNLLHLQDLGFPHVGDFADTLKIDPHSLAAAARHARVDTPALDLPPALAQALNQRGWGCSLANALALQTQSDWYSRRTQHLVAAAAAWLKRTPDEVQRGLQRQAVSASSEARFTRGVRAPAVGLLWPPRPPRALAKPSPRCAEAPVRKLAPWMPIEPTASTLAHDRSGAAAPSVDAKQADSTPAPAPLRAATQRPAEAAGTFDADSAGLNAYLQRCERAAFADLPELLGSTLRLFAALQLRRSALFLRKSGSDQLGCYVAQGFAPIQARGLSIAPGEHGLIPRLLAQPSSAFWVQAAQLPGIGDKLPTPLADWPSSTGFALSCVQAGGHAFGFWWVDSGSTGNTLTPARFAGFRRACAGFGPECARLMRKQRQLGSPSGEAPNQTLR